MEKGVLRKLYLAEDAPIPPPRSTPEKQRASQRGRMLQAMVEVVADRGFAAVTVGDVVARARVSRRTFYEQFASKEDCFLAAYQTGIDFVLSETAGLTGGDGNWATHLRENVGRYLETLANAPAFARALIVEVSAAGPTLRNRRTEVNEQFAAQFKSLHAYARLQDTRVAELPDPAFLGLVGAMDELVIAEILRGRTSGLRALEPDLSRLVAAAFLGAGGADSAMRQSKD